MKRLERLILEELHLYEQLQKTIKMFYVYSIKDYKGFLEILVNSANSPDLEDRKKYSAKAFQTSSHYDTGNIQLFLMIRKMLKVSIKKSLKH